MRPQIAVDFDGTLAEYTKWQGESTVGEPIPGAVEFIRGLNNTYDVIIFSARASTEAGRIAIRRWVIRNKLAGIVKDITNQKKYSFVAYVDDRAIPFKEPNDYNRILEMLK